MSFAPRRSVALVAALLLISAGSVGLTASPATAATQASFIVSPNGAGTACSVAAPCSLDEAQSQVRALATSMTGDLVVTLTAGTYPGGLELDSSDSGHGGYRVIYQADPSVPVGSVTIDGGLPITGWAPTPGGSALNLYEASVPDGFDTRQLFVNDVRSTVASQPASVVLGSMTKTSTGFTYTATGPNSWTGADRTVLVFNNGWPWTYSHCPVDAMGSGTITVAQPCFDAANAIMKVGSPSEIQNNLALLTEPGQFFVDTAADKIYYIPRANENLSTASVVAARDEHLLTGQNLSNVTVQGITFAHATFRFDDSGVLSAQANGLLKSNNLADQRMLPGAVSCHGCDHVEFRRNTFEHLGGSGLQLDEGGVANSVIGNVFRDISGNGVNVGVSYQPTTDWQPSAYEDGTVVSNNYLFDIGNEYLGGVGVFAGWVKNTTISHNEVGAVSYSGISLGFGAGAHGISQMVNNHIDNNYVHDVLTSSVHDGGAIYMNGTQGASPRSSVSGNHVQHQGDSVAALYLDDGVSNVDVTGNVVDGYAPYWLLSKTSTNTATGNYVWWRSYGVHGTGGSNVSGNFDKLTSWPAGAQSIMSAAGLESAFTDIRPGGRETNLSWDAAVTASSTNSADVAPSRAVDGSNGLGGSFNAWISTGEANAWWQVDLGAPTDLSKVEILFRQDANYYPNQQKNFRVLVSNDSSVTSGYTEACARTNPTSWKARFDCTPPAGEWRYVTIMRTDTPTQGFVFSEVRVYGHASTPATSAAPLTFDTTTSSWSAYPGRAATRIAVDGTDKPWIVDWSGNLQRWNGYGWATVRKWDVQDVAIGANGHIAIVKKGTQQVLRSTDSGATWTDTGGLGTAVTVDASGAIWAVRSGGTLWKLDGASWIQVGTPSNKVVTDVGTVGSTVTVTTDAANYNYIYQLDGTSWTFAWGQGVAVAGDSSGYITALSTTGAVYRGKAPFALTGTWSQLRPAPGAIDVGVGASSGRIWIVSK